MITNFFFLYDPFGYVLSPVSLIVVGLTVWLFLRGLKIHARCLGRVSGWRRTAFFVGLETEKDGTIDEIVWNSHRVYGPKRLPQFFANIKVTDSIPPAQFFFGRKVD